MACAWGAQVPAETAEILTLARRLSASTPVALVTIGSPEGAGEIASEHGADEIHVITGDALHAFKVDTWVAALSQYCSAFQPAALIFGQSFESRQLAPLLAGRLSSPIVMNVLDARSDGNGRLRVTASAFGGDTHAEYVVDGSAIVILCVMPNAVKPEAANPAGRAVMTEFRPDLSGVTERVRVVSPAQSIGPRLEDAQVIVAGGRGLGKAENFALVEKLAEALGGVAAASRPIVDDGWTDSSRQIGLTGKIVRPALYIAAGISGASQHMAGCSAAKTIVAINSDPDAPIFRYASFGVIGDCLEILPEMARALAEEYAGDGTAK
ncbi:MAG TPA: electron transfer flavoprotein subunit alpha/FixB family protein [Dehalococcoidia bacterium]|nr:electron transfer flavoprotein subunit alpha/FixB family protein [Dehalococcoidia bacterium]